MCSWQCITGRREEGGASGNKDFVEQYGSDAAKQMLALIVAVIKKRERKPARGYRDGVAQGRRAMARDISSIIDKHLTVQLKPDKQHNKVTQRAFEKFKGLLEEGADK